MLENRGGRREEGKKERGEGRYGTEKKEMGKWSCGELAGGGAGERKQNGGGK